MRINHRRIASVFFLMVSMMLFSFKVTTKPTVIDLPVFQTIVESLVIENEMFKLGGVLSAQNADGKISSQQKVITSPTEVDITTWEPGKYILVFKSNNYNSIVATIDIP